MTRKGVFDEYAKARKTWIDSVMRYHHEEEIATSKALHADRVIATRRMNRCTKPSIPQLKDDTGAKATTAKEKADLLNRAFANTTLVPADFPENKQTRENVIPEVNEALENVTFDTATGASRFGTAIDISQPAPTLLSASICNHNKLLETKFSSDVLSQVPNVLNEKITSYEPKLLFY